VAEIADTAEDTADEDGADQVTIKPAFQVKMGDVRKGLCNAFDYASKGSARLALRKGQLIGDPQRTVSKLTTYVGHAR
jgi:hypothetical protein